MCILPRPGFETGQILFATGLVYTAYVGLVCVFPLPCFLHDAWFLGFCLATS